ncbi:hypothetical protein LMG28614_06765 [Paraburkholderia ultramafica]|uniref:Uncharacterized protein n=1 Tax=Paraburkholderia ultramafica TaxID=1544867 RepID=A0A6S7BPX7_9BURK|nr:hypothetical protein [Paraburkholderia ultramafica]CAB3808258.1 hypothetical protein LMG28614_06765 [Paraburkholderia ultramafica]
MDVHAAVAALARQARPIHHELLYGAVKRFFTAVTAAAMSENSPHALANGMNLESAWNFAGHDSLDTTSIYATAELGRQYREAETFLWQAEV